MLQRKGAHASCYRKLQPFCNTYDKQQTTVGQTNGEHDEYCYARHARHARHEARTSWHPPLHRYRQPRQVPPTHWRWRCYHPGCHACSPASRMYLWSKPNGAAEDEALRPGPLCMAGTCDVRMRLSFSPETSSAHCLIEAISCSASAALGLTDDAALTSTERSDADTNELAASVAIPTVPRAPDSSRRWVRLFFPQNTNTKLRHRGQARGSRSGAPIGQRVTRTVDCGFESTKRQFRATQQCFPTVFLMM